MVAYSCNLNSQEWKQENQEFKVILFSCRAQGQPGLDRQLWLSLNSLCRPGQPQIYRSACLCLQSVGIKGLYHHIQLHFFLRSNNRSSYVYLTTYLWTLLDSCVWGGHEPQKFSTRKGISKPALMQLGLLRSHGLRQVWAGWGTGETQSKTGGDWWEVGKVGS